MFGLLASPRSQAWTGTVLVIRKCLAMVGKIEVSAREERDFHSGGRLMNQASPIILRRRGGDEQTTEYSARS